jgi:hypothetical protein
MLTFSQYFERLRSNIRPYLSLSFLGFVIFILGLIGLFIWSIYGMVRGFDSANAIFPILSLFAILTGAVIFVRFDPLINQLPAMWRRYRATVLHHFDELD